MICELSRLFSDFLIIFGTIPIFSIGESDILVYDVFSLGHAIRESPINNIENIKVEERSITMGIITKCPVCFTKMNLVGHDLVCPECGYKYCEKKDPYTYDDHNHNAYQSYNQKTSYTGAGNYTSSSGQTRPADSYSQTRPANSYPAQGSAQNTGQASMQARQAMQNQSQQNQSKRAVTPGRIVAIIITIYFIMIFMSMIIAFVFRF